MPSKQRQPRRQKAAASPCRRVDFTVDDILSVVVELLRNSHKELFETMALQKAVNEMLENNAKLLFVNGQVDHTGDPSKLTATGKWLMWVCDRVDESGEFTDFRSRLAAITAELRKSPRTKGA